MKTLLFLFHKIKIISHKILSIMIIKHDIHLLNSFFLNITYLYHIISNIHLKYGATPKPFEQSITAPCITVDF